jgi:hypothetical protein
VLALYRVYLVVEWASVGKAGDGLLFEGVDRRRCSVRRRGLVFSVL